ncbi:MAG: ABC transporter ATP-binding protein [Thermodesulfobacteriota bacterium]
MILLDRVSKRYGTGSGAGPFVLQDVSLSLERNRFVCLLGPSGCGKTTLLNLVAGFLAPSAGRVLVDGVGVSGPGPDRGVVFQDATLFPWMTVLDNVRFGLRQQGIAPEQATAAAEECLALVGMAAHAGEWPVRLSGGMRQRVAIARILALQPKVMLFDEPFSALDANSRERLQAELLRICAARPATVIYITHSVEEAAFLAERVIVVGPAPASIHADIALPAPRPRARNSQECNEIKSLLRARLDALPCCITPCPSGGCSP